MTRLTQTARRGFGTVSNMIVNASRQFIPQHLNSWKLALYLIVFVLPGGSFLVLGMGWLENRYWRKSSSASAQKKVRALLPAPCTPCPCSGGGSASGA